MKRSFIVFTFVKRSFIVFVWLKDISAIYLGYLDILCSIMDIVPIHQNILDIQSGIEMTIRTIDLNRQIAMMMMKNLGKTAWLKQSEKTCI